LLFQSEDGSLDPLVTGFQTCALPIYRRQQSELGRGKIHGGQQSDLSQIGDRALEGEGSRLARREIRGPSQRLLEGQKLTAHPHRAWRVPTRYPGQRGECEPCRGHEEAPEMEDCEL